MTVVRSGGTALFTGTAIVVPEHTQHESVNVDGGAVHIDADDSEHVLRIKHSTGDGVDVFAAVDKDTGVKTAFIDSSGVADVSDVRWGVNNTSLNQFATSIQADFDAATANDDGATNNLVKRGQAHGTKIDNLQVIASDTNYKPGEANPYPPAGLFFTRGACTESLDLLDDGQLFFQPYDSQGSPIEGRRFTFGRAQPLVGETITEADSRRDGILVEDATADQSCEVLCSNELPTIRIVSTKATTTVNNFTGPVCPVIQVSDGAGNTNYAVYDDGFVTQKGHQDSDPDALNSGHFDALVTGDKSVHRLDTPLVRPPQQDAAIASRRARPSTCRTRASWGPRPGSHSPA